MGRTPELWQAQTDITVMLMNVGSGMYNMHATWHVSGLLPTWDVVFHGNVGISAGTAGDCVQLPASS